MDLATLLGLVICFGLIIFGIVTGDQGFAALKNFLDFQSVLITIGGTFCATLASFKMSDFINGIKGFTIALKQRSFEQMDIIKKIRRVRSCVSSARRSTSTQRLWAISYPLVLRHF